MDKYLQIYEQMADGVWYKASELGVAAQTLTAMIRRNLVEKMDGKPNKYRKLPETVAAKILKILDKHPAAFFTLWRGLEEIGMLCSMKNGIVLDCWEQPYDLTGISRIAIYGEGKGKIFEQEF